MINDIFTVKFQANGLGTRVEHDYKSAEPNVIVLTLTI